MRLTRVPSVWGSERVTIRPYPADENCAGRFERLGTVLMILRVCSLVTCWHCSHKAKREGGSLTLAHVRWSS